MAINNGAASTLNLQTDGGNLTIGNVTEVISTFKGTLTAQRALGGQTLIVKDTGASGVGADPYLAFHDSVAARIGYVGVASAATNDMYLLSDAGNIQITAGGGTINLNDNTVVNGTVSGNYFEATALGPLTTPGNEDLYVGGYGILGDRTTNPVYLSNASGPVALNHSGVHGAAATHLITHDDGVRIQGTLNTAATPALSFGDGDTGIYESVDDELSFSIAGTRRWKMTGTTFGADSNAGPGLFDEVGSSTNPVIIPRITDGNTGIGWGSDDILSLIAGGTEMIRIVETTTDYIEMKAETRLLDNILSRPVLEDYAIESNTQNVSGTTVTFTYSNGPTFQCDMEAATGNVTATLSGGPPSGDHGQMTIKVNQDTTVRTLAWAGGTFRWAGGTAHPVTTTANGWTIYTFETWDGGTIWYGSGADYS